jgi:predicted phosphodiesterase
LGVIARIGIYGDIHLSSKDYGAHRDYPKECMEYFSKITEITERRELTHLIGCGDFSFGRFHSLEFRQSVEEQLERQFKAVNGNRYELFGNHDVAGYGMTERDYYIAKGLLKPSTNLTLGNLNITMVDYGKYNDTDPNIIDDNDHYNFIIAHDYFKFANTRLQNFGRATELDNFEKWFGADAIICGHIHKILDFSGYIVKGDEAKECQVHYLGCMSRPKYLLSGMDEVGHVMIVTVMDNGTVDIENEVVKLWDISDSFNVEAKGEETLKKAEKAEHVDISDVVRQLDAHDSAIGNPEDIIQDLDGVKQAYKDKAIELLKMALN